MWRRDGREPGPEARESAAGIASHAEMVARVRVDHRWTQDTHGRRVNELPPVYPTFASTSTLPPRGALLR